MEHRGSFSMLHHFYPARDCFLDRSHDHCRATAVLVCLLLKETQAADVLFIIGCACWGNRDSARALPYLQRSLEIKEAFFGKDSPELMTTLMMLGLTCEAEQLNTAAIDYFERYLVIQDKHPNRYNNYTPDILDHLADLYRYQANY